MWSILLAPGKCKFKPQWEIIQHPSNNWNSKRLTLNSGGVEQIGLSYIIGGSKIWYNILEIFKTISYSVKHISML